jgi:hypothetical protein
VFVFVCFVLNILTARSVFVPLFMHSNIQSHTHT